MLLINFLLLAESGADYNATAEPNTLTLEAGQDVACSTIAIFNDTFVEADEVFNVTVMNYSDTFYAGVDIIQETATIEIMDNDREFKFCLTMLHFMLMYT